VETSFGPGCVAGAVASDQADRSIIQGYIPLQGLGVSKPKRDAELDLVLRLSLGWLRGSKSDLIIIICQEFHGIIMTDS
jgi:hypothetical protein